MSYWGGWSLRSGESIQQFANFGIDLLHFPPETFLRDDVLFDKTPYTIEEVILKSPDFEEIYQFYPNVKAYWIQWRGLAPST